MGAAMSQSTGN